MLLFMACTKNGAKQERRVPLCRSKPCQGEVPGRGTRPWIQSACSEVPQWVRRSHVMRTGRQVLELFLWLGGLSVFLSACLSVSLTREVVRSSVCQWGVCMYICLFVCLCVCVGVSPSLYTSVSIRFYLSVLFHLFLYPSACLSRSPLVHTQKKRWSVDKESLKSWMHRNTRTPASSTNVTIQGKGN